ncbi:FAD-dependent oxidoreductase [Curvibacter sp. APW13]|uniref:FAD-dependent oxidoreductase n=1 Tax=Curvibacter sp. APW13 TaxID=3077236 RepID=UPI0028DFEED6|nr:FAD-dependent oxidoreductase [Curvibacter sp. APW13]MDT8992501.1 FAD-dependent oxidoreductase [Curvibacter sp. APW13]
MTARRFALAVALLAVVALFWATDAHRYLRLDYLQSAQGEWTRIYAQHPWSVRALYFLLYVAVTALSLPGAAVLTLAGGAVLGFGWGLLLVSFASTLGATFAFWSARYLLRDAVTRRLGPRLDAIHAGLTRDGTWYLLSLRLIPVVPFFLVNLAMGLTRQRTWTYYWVSQLGMLPGTAVFVWAGTELGQLRSVSDVMNAPVLGALVTLGLFPWVAKAALAWVQARRALGPWAAQRPQRFDRNLIVIGGGAAGLVSAYMGAALKAKVTLVEAQALGGDCLHTGCVPSKALLRCARAADQARHASRYGIDSWSRNEYTGQVPISFPKVMAYVQQAVAAIAPHDSIERYTALGVEVLQGQARLRTPWAVDIRRADGSVQTLTARSIVIATGASPVVPALPGLADIGHLTSDTLWDAMAKRDAPPARLVVLGGGPMGCELAQAFARLGSQVELVELAAQLLQREDPDVGAAVRSALEADGVRVHTATRALRCERAPDGSKRLVVETAGRQAAIVLDELLCALGRQARLDGLGLEGLGIPAHATVQTNDYLQTLLPHIYAAGDVAGPFQLTHAAAHQAGYASVNALLGGLWRFKVPYGNLPAVTFVDPEVACVGLNVQEAQARGIPFEVTRYDLDDLDRALCDGEARGWVKVLTVPGRDRILGATIVGSHAGELLAPFTLAMTHGLGLNRILGTVHPYPTWSESAKYAAGAWKRAHAPTAALRWLQRYFAWQRR